MKSFAFIVSPITIRQIKDFWPMLKIVPNFIIKSSLKNLPPFKVSHIKKIQSIQGKAIEGFLIVCPLLHQQAQDLEENLVIDKVLAAGRIAERLGSRVIGLDNCASVIGDKGYDAITRNLKIPVTSGNALNTWSVFEGVYRMAKAKKINLKSSNLVIIGATDPIGSLCARKLSDYVSKITIVAEERNELEQLKERILYQNPIEVIIEEDAHRAVKDADIVINANNSSEPAFNVEELKPDAIVCDIPPFYRVRVVDRPNPRQDIIIIRGGLIKMPYPLKGINTDLPKGIIYASLAETMLLTFEEKFVNYSFGDNINLDKLEEIADLAVQHGFEVWVPEAPVI